ncbi:MAG: HAD family hydrolase [Syntrophomonadaceae bacterium]|nr:HAD family hydrolase [Syntrophomonadaceae bacterium]
MGKAIFLDRDGVIIKEKGYISSLEQVEIFPYAADCLTRLKKAGYILIVITNQSAVARGIISENELERIHSHLLQQLPLDDIYYCPHYPMVPEQKPYGIRCTCRKPETGLISRAVVKHGIDLRGSYMVGDRASDILTGQNAGIKTILLNSGYGLERMESTVYPDFTFADLQEFCDFLLG